ncbi:NADH dehydrogenase [ubiquinone] 1 alpha subcomplex assembly factor 3 [Neomonachus schauinslandi]|uniref:NADH dehydrogenase [ubiquinone] 1 alpha subcomplex assembly factor 3 n=2 Tax=Monachinae TaxID=3410119 RepID=A0A2U3Z6P8_LEPWE|nr:NADH dehydrogenase [ubiquinone] 1 alpha subcomplex assembly factor 3 [Leptonychotes weddellii]XP_021542710.1 NADH dehydrogenase [ubiquinone] 1 alpha subcomplex assembly factor 3 [Neomonachus schauinslandi]
MVAAFVLPGLCRARAVLRCSPAELLRAPRRGHRLTPADDELYQRTRISLLQRESPQSMYIDSYSSRGFTVNGNRVLGPCALLPHSVVQWNVGTHRDITEESFSLFWLLEPQIEIVVVGTGARTERLQPQVLQALRQRGIAVEVQDTPNACATFNFLCHEGRVTGAALIPPPGGTVLTGCRRNHQELSSPVQEGAGTSRSAGVSSAFISPSPLAL